MKLRKLFSITLLFVLYTLSFCACGLSADGLTADERKALKTQAIAAEQYYEEKYDCDIKIEGRQYMEGNVINGPAYNTDTMIFFTSEKTLIVYEVADNLFLDNQQAEEIHNAIQNELIPGILSEIGYEYYWDNKSFFCNQKYLAPNTLVNLYHEYYDANNPEEFFMTEKPYNRMVSPIYIINADASEHNNIVNSIYEPLCLYFNLDSLWVNFVTDDFEIEEIFLRDFGKDGFIATYHKSDSFNFFAEQHYVKLIDGVYVASYRSNTKFKEGDVFVAGEINSEEAMNLYNDAYIQYVDSEEEYSHKSIWASGDILYEIELNPQYIEEVKNSDNYEPTYSSNPDYFDNNIYVKIVPSELDQKIEHFCIMTIYDNKSPVIDKYNLDETIFISLNNKESVKKFLYFTHY